MPTDNFIAAHAAKKPATSPGLEPPLQHTGATAARRPTSSHHRAQEAGQPGLAAACHHKRRSAAAAQKPRLGPAGLSCRCHHHARPPRASQLAATTATCPARAPYRWPLVGRYLHLPGAAAPTTELHYELQPKVPAPLWRRGLPPPRQGSAAGGVREEGACGRGS
jgi:hypothetical protein